MTMSSSTTSGCSACIWSSRRSPSLRETTSCPALRRIDSMSFRSETASSTTITFAMGSRPPCQSGVGPKVQRRCHSGAPASAVQRPDVSDGDTVNDRAGGASACDPLASRERAARHPGAHAAARGPHGGGVTYDVAMTTLGERETLELYEKTGALMRGHFRLTSGLHSDVYLQSALVLMYPEHAARLGEALGAPFADARAQTVLAPAIGGILVAHEGARALVTEREDGVMRLRRGFTLTPGERCLVVEDVITTGGSTREVVDCVRASGGAVVGVGCLIDRSGGAALFDVKQAALATVAATTWPPESCPLCRTGGQAVKPGSRA